MSWDWSTKEIKCPFGKGKIVQRWADDDWNRTKYETPTIECKDCKQLYTVVTINHHSIYSWKGDSTSYFLMKKDDKNKTGDIEKDGIRLDL